MSAVSEPRGRLRSKFSPPLLPTYDMYYSIFYFKVFLFCLMVILGLVVLVDLLENFDEFARYSTAHGLSNWSMLLMLVSHYAVFAPGLVCQFMISSLPVAAAVLVVTQASLNREFTVMRASGVSLQRTVMPFLVLALVFGTLYTLTRDLYVPMLLRKSFVMRNNIRPMDIIPPKVTPLSDGENLHFVEMGHFDGDSGTAYNLRVEIRVRDDYFSRRNNFTEYRARKAFLQPLSDIDNPNTAHRYQWTPSEGGVVTRYSDNNHWNYPWEVPLPTGITRSMLERQVLTTKVMEWHDLLLLEDTDLEARLEIHSRLSEPFAAFAMLMMVLPLILWITVRGQQPSYITNAVVTVAVCGFFYVLRVGFMSWGESAYIPPFLAAQLPGLIYIIVGGIMLSRVES